MANKNNSSRAWLSQFYDKVTPSPSIEETVDPKIEALQAIMDRVIPVRAETLVVSLPAPTTPKALDDFYKSQEANIDALEKSMKELDKLNIEMTEISKSLEVQAEDTGNNGQVLTSPSNENKKHNKRNRKDNLTRAIEAVIKIFGKKPSFDELWRFFQDDKDETTFIEDYTDTHITWRDTKGKFHDTPKDTLANRLSRIKL